MSDLPPTPVAAERRDPLIDSLVAGRFRIESAIGKGGMGVVYRATQEGLGRIVALKVMQLGNIPPGDRAQFEKRFALEASTCARLRHPNLVKVFDYGQLDGGGYFIAMEFLRGRSLQTLITQDGPLPPARVIKILRQIASGLREAHGLGIVHRDLKPDNILLLDQGDDREFVKIIDFGLVKDLGHGEDLTRDGAYMGTPKYMAPEQVRGAAVDRRTDLYALGVVTYAMLTKRVPFAEPTPLATLVAQIKQPPPSMADVAPSVVVPRLLELVVRKLLAKAPHDRFADADAFITALDKFEQGLLVEEEVATRFTVAHEPPRIQDQQASHNEATIVAEGAVLEHGRRFSRRGAIVITATCVIGGVAALVAGVGSTAHAPPAVTGTASTPQPRAEGPLQGASAKLARGQTDGQRFPLRVMLSSTPPGAMVQIDSQPHGPTPSVAELYSGTAWVARTLTLVFSLKGHVTSTVTRLVDGPELNVHAELEKASGELARAPGVVKATQSSAVPTRARARTNAGPSDAKPEPKGRGYRASPY